MAELKNKKFLKKLHIVQLSQKTHKTKKRIDKIDQIDTMTFSEDAAKLLSLISTDSTLFLFMVNCERVQKSHN